MALKNRDLSPHSSRGWESEIRLPTWSVSGGSSSWLVGDCHHAVCSSDLFTVLEGWGGGAGGEMGERVLLSDISSYKDTNPVESGPHPYELI